MNLCSVKLEDFMKLLLPCWNLEFGGNPDLCSQAIVIQNDPRINYLFIPFKMSIVDFLVNSSFYTFQVLKLKVVWRLLGPHW